MPEEIKLEISAASVKVMRSYDYCHFEVCLSGTKPLSIPITSAEVDVSDRNFQAYRRPVYDYEDAWEEEEFEPVEFDDDAMF